MRFGDKLRQLREAAGMSQKALADVSGQKQHVVSDRSRPPGLFATCQRPRVAVSVCRRISCANNLSIKPIFGFTITHTWVIIAIDGDKVKPRRTSGLNRKES